MCCLNKNASGMTLIELLVSMIILTIASLTIFGMHSMGASNTTLSNSLTVASFLAESHAEWLRAQASLGRVATESGDPVRLTKEGEVCPDDSVDPACVYTRTTTVAPKSPSSLSCAVSIQVEGPGLGRKSKLIYNTVISSDGF